MSAEDAEEYTRALGQVMAGGWRHIALAQKLGVPEALGMTPSAWARERIGGHVRLGLAERREAARELTDPKGEFRFSHRGAADVLGVGKGTVQRDLQDGPDGPPGVTAPEDDTDGDGPSGPREELAEPSVEVSLADIGGEPLYPDESEPDPRQRSVGDDDVRGYIRDHFDEAALADDRELDGHLDAMLRVRVTWLRFMGANPPGVFARGLDRAGLAALDRDLESFAEWLGQARACALAARRPRRA